MAGPKGPLVAAIVLAAPVFLCPSVLRADSGTASDLAGLPAWFWLLLCGLASLLALAFAVRNTRLRSECRRRSLAEAEQTAALALLQTQLQEVESKLAQESERCRELDAGVEAERKQRKLLEEGKAKLEAQLQQAQKMESLGTLASGLAHEFNNTLAIIIPSAHLALEECPKNPELRESLTQILTAADRAKHLVRQIISFGRPQQRERLLMDLTATVKEVRSLLKAAISAHIRIDLRMAEHPPLVLSDQSQIQQMLMNLGNNAAQALRDRTQGAFIRFSLDAVRIEGPDNSELQGLQAGLYLRISVLDNGCGITKQVLPRIFEPFFTTRPLGEGTGMGLAVVHGIIKAHGGAIRVSSQEGEGTEMVVYLPGKAAADASAPLVRAVPQKGEGQRLLLVDDEKVVAVSTARYLQVGGYRVDYYTDPHRALEAFRADPEAYQLVLTDRSMPEMSGLDLSLKINEIKPGMRVVMITGYGADVNAENAIRHGIRRILSKPLLPQELMAVVHEVLQS